MAPDLPRPLRRPVKSISPPNGTVPSLSTGRPTNSDPTPEKRVRRVEPGVEEISVEKTDAVAETIEEIRFYLEHSMVDQARAAFTKLQTQTADYEQIAALHAEIDAASSSEEPRAEIREPRRLTSR